MTLPFESVSELGDGWVGVGPGAAIKHLPDYNLSYCGIHNDLVCVIPPLPATPLMIAHGLHGHCIVHTTIRGHNLTTDATAAARIMRLSKRCTCNVSGGGREGLARWRQHSMDRQLPATFPQQNVLPPLNCSSMSRPAEAQPEAVAPMVDRRLLVKLSLAGSTGRLDLTDCRLQVNSA
jgi:hypothetical protein